jgi:hypothetical protein
MKNLRRLTIGPRGGDERLMPTPCSECVSFQGCRPGAATQPWGCFDWVNGEGRRISPRDSMASAEEEACPECGYSPECAECGKEWDGPEGFELSNPEPEPAPFEPEDFEGAQGVLPMPDASPLFGGQS